MNWKSEIEQRLRDYPAMRASLKNLPLELSRIRKLAKDAAEEDPQPSDTLLDTLTWEQQLQQNLQHAQQFVHNTEAAFSALTTEEHLILGRFYLNPKPGAVFQLCADLGVEQSSIYRRKDKALRKYAMALYGFRS